MFRRVASGVAIRQSCIHARCTAFSTTATLSAQMPHFSQNTTSEESSLPRWLRRQDLQKGSDKINQEPAVVKKKEPLKYRSKHLHAQTEKDVEQNKQGLKLLEPHVLSQRLKKLCDKGKMDDAVALLKSSPLDAQNTPVWNTLIWEIMKAKRYKLAYSLYIDVRNFFISAGSFVY